MKHHIYKSVVGAATFIIGVTVAAFTIRKTNVAAEELLFLFGGVWLWFCCQPLFSLPVWFFGVVGLSGRGGS
jgi:hypothetical protein